MTRHEMMEKVRKLLALAQSENEHEAASAAARASAIMERHEIEAADLGEVGDRGGEQIEEAVFDEMGKRLVQWRARLAAVLAEAHGCCVYSRRSPDGTRSTQVVGLPSDAERARLLFDYCVSEISRLSVKKAAGQGRAFANAYRHGCVEAIAHALSAERENLRSEAEARGSASALVVADRQEAAQQEMLERHRFGRASRAQVTSLRGLARGRVDGGRIYPGRRRVPGPSRPVRLEDS